MKALKIMVISIFVSMIIFIIVQKNEADKLQAKIDSMPLQKHYKKLDK